MNTAERRIDLRETPVEECERRARRRFLETPEPHTALGELDSLTSRIERVWNLQPRTLLSDVKREEIRADAEGEALWLLQGGSPE